MGGSRLCFWSSVAEAGAGRVVAHLPAQKPVPVCRPGQRPERLAWVKPAVPSCSAPFEAAESRPSFSARLGPRDAGGTLTQQLEKPAAVYQGCVHRRAPISQGSRETPVQRRCLKR